MMYDYQTVLYCIFTVPFLLYFLCCSILIADSNQIVSSLTPNHLTLPAVVKVT